MSKYTDIPMINIYSSLGYEKKSSRRNLQALDTAIQSFYREHRRQGHVISISKKDTLGARLCALSFLEEEDRGEKFWPVNSDGDLAWATHREVIIDLLQNIFRRKAYSEYVAKMKEIRNSETTTDEKPKRVKKRSRKSRCNDDDVDGIRSKTTQNKDEFIPSSLEPTTVKPWNDPPEEPTPMFCVNYIRDLNPQRDLAPVAEFHKKWLSAKHAKWPTSADKRLLRFMFDNSLFMDYNYGDDVSTELLRILREGTEIEEMIPSEVVRFRDRVIERIEELTSQLTKKPFFILAYRRDGVVRMTERFERMWKKKGAHWEDDDEDDPGLSQINRQRPAKKPRKSRAVRAKVPIVFPDLQEQQKMRSQMELVGSQMQLGTIAETALELSAGKEEEHERRIEESFFADAMNLSSDPEIEFVSEVLIPQQSSMRGASPGNSTVAEQSQMEEESPNTTPSFSSPRDYTVPGKHGSCSRTLESTSTLTRRPSNATSPNLPDSKLPSEISIGEAAHLDEHRLANSRQEVVDQLVSSMRDLSDFGRSCASAGQSVSPAKSTASKALANMDSISVRTSSSQYRQQSTARGNDGSIGGCLPKEHTGIKRACPQRSTTAERTAGLMMESPNQDGCQSSSDTLKKGQYKSPYMPQAVKNRHPKYASHEPHTSNRPGSRRLLSVELDDSDRTTSSVSVSGNEALISVIKSSAEAGKRINESMSYASRVGSRPVSPLSSTSNELHGLLGSQADRRAVDQQPQQKNAKEPQDSSILQSQVTHTEYGPISAQHLVYTDDNPSPQFPPIHGGTRWKSYAPIPEKPKITTSSGSRPNNCPPFSTQRPDKDRESSWNSSTSMRNDHPKSPMQSSPSMTTPLGIESLQDMDRMQSGSRGTSIEGVYYTLPPMQLPACGGTWRSKEGPSRTPTLNKAQTTTTSGQIHLESSSNVILMEKYRSTRAPWSLGDAASSRLNSATSESKGANCAQASLPPSNMTDSNQCTGNGSAQHDGSADHGLQRTFPAPQTASQVREELGQKMSAAPPPIESINTAASVEHAEAQRAQGEDSTPRSSETGEPSKTSLSTEREFLGSLNMAPSKIAQDSLRDVNSFIKSMDEFIMKERGHVAGKEISLEPTSCSTSTSRPPCQQSQSELCTPQETSPQVQAAMSQPNHITPLPVATKPIEATSAAQDAIQTSETSLVSSTQEMINPPAEPGTPHRRDGFYSFVPAPLPFSPYKSTTSPSATPIPLSMDTRLATTSKTPPTKPTLILIIDCADGTMSLDTTHPFAIVKNSTLSEFFQFYASVSGTPLSSLTSLKFSVAFGNKQSPVVRRYGGENAWSRLKAVIPTLFTDAVRRDREGEMEWRILVSDASCEEI